MRELNTCDTKVPYYSWREALLAAEDQRKKFGTCLKPYPCRVNKGHYHLTHANPAQRKGHGNLKRYRRCPWCKQIYRRYNFNDQWKHFDKRCLKLNKEQQKR